MVSVRIIELEVELVVNLFGKSEYATTQLRRFIGFDYHCNVDDSERPIK